MITSGSGLERFIYCLGSSVLPRAHEAGVSEYATRGQVLHKYLQRVGEGMAAGEALELVEDEHREAAAAIDLEGLSDVLGLSAEMTFAYNPAFDTARVLGVGLDRDYIAAGLTEDEIPVTMDVVGVDNPTAPTRGKVIDFKTGFQRITAAAHNWQMKGGALCLARVFDLDEVDVQLIHLRENKPAWRDRSRFTAADIAVAAAQTRARWDEVSRARDRYERTKIDPEVTKGSWCRHCPSYHECPAQMNLVRAAVQRDEYEVYTREGGLAPNQVAAAFRMLRDIDEPRRRLKAAIYAAAKERPVLIETLPDGQEVWLGVTPVEGNLKLDAKKAREIVREMLGEQRNDGTKSDPAEEISLFTVSQDRIEAACKLRVPKGKGAEKMRAVMAELKRRGGAAKPTKHEVDLYKIRPHAIAAKAG